MSDLRSRGSLRALAVFILLSAAIAGPCAVKNPDSPRESCDYASLSNMLRLYLGDMSINGPKVDVPQDRATSVTSMLELRD